MPRTGHVFVGVLLVLSAVHPVNCQNALDSPSRATTQQVSSPADLPILLSANLNSFSRALTVDAPDEPKQEDFVLGPLSNSDFPDLQILPSIQIQKSVKSGSKWDVTGTVSGRIPFGTSTVPIYFRGTKTNTLRILKSGLAIDSFPQVQSEDHQLLLVLRNPASLGYDSVSIRLRFNGIDSCDFVVEQFPKLSTRSGSSDCADVSKWSSFSLPQYAGVSLRGAPPHAWFVDNATDLARNGKQKGLLTLRYVSGGNNGPQVVDEQNIPVETEFQLGLLSRTRQYLSVACWLLVGALASVLLRVAIPNYRRYRSLREDLIEIQKVTRGITEEVDSMLRVQLRVERLSLDTLRKSVSVISPGFTPVDQRVSSGIATLNRRIGYVRRLDASLNRKRLLVADELAPPSRIAAIERHLDLASEALKSAQFREEDWVLIQQALEAADKYLNDPSEDDKSAFETSLVGRWQNIGGHFGFAPGGGWTLSPDLAAMAACFPLPESLPKAGDDGRKWIEEIGIVRADLQISALELIREFEFLAPAAFTDHWVVARDRLITWLATPALDNLNEARTLLRQLAEGIDPPMLIAALQAGEAQVELDPQSVGSGERLRMSVRFRRPALNSAAARREITCEWRISAESGALQSGTPESSPVATSLGQENGNSRLPATEVSDSNRKEAGGAGKAAARRYYYRERGWNVYHYFESFLKNCPLEVRFYREGKQVNETGDDPNSPLIYRYEIDLGAENAARRTAARRDSLRRGLFESIELGAVLLVPLCALTISTADQNTTGYWWQLIGLGFGSDTIRSVLTGQTNASAKTSQAPSGR